MSALQPRPSYYPLGCAALQVSTSFPMVMHCAHALLPRYCIRLSAPSSHSLWSTLMVYKSSGQLTLRSVLQQGVQSVQPSWKEAVSRRRTCSASRLPVIRTHWLLTTSNMLIVISDEVLFSTRTDCVSTGVFHGAVNNSPRMTYTPCGSQFMHTNTHCHPCVVLAHMTKHCVYNAISSSADLNKTFVLIIAQQHPNR